MKKISKWFLRSTEFITAMMLAVIFFTFLIQIFTRYAAKIAWAMPLPFIADWMAQLRPLSWTVNLISLLWVWVVFFGGAFIVRERDHITFDLLHVALPAKGRRILFYAATVITVAAMLYSLPAIWDFVFNNRLMELKKIAAISIPVTGAKIPVKWLFASIFLFMVITIIRYPWRLVAALRGRQEDRKGEPGHEH